MIALSLAGIALISLLAQWLAWSVRVPAILFLLLSGLLLGPVTGLLDPDQLLGDLLFPLVSLSVAIILFEGALTLHLTELKGIGKVVRNLCSTGMVTSFAVIGAASYFLLGLDWRVAMVLGAVLVVTGPTVIAPMLNVIRPVREVDKILRWEGIVIDPIGALFAVLVFEAVRLGSQGDLVGHTLLALAKTVGVGSLIGVGAGWLTTLLIRKDWLPVSLHKFGVLALVLVTFTLSDWLSHESGLLAVTVFGIWLANQEGLDLEEVLAFKEDLAVILISSLFILLAARLDLAQLWQLGPMVLALLCVVQFVARPLCILVSTRGSELPWRARALLAWIAPRGIVAAAVSASFAISMHEAGIEDADKLVPLVFAVIIFTVVLQSLTATPLARLLDMRQSAPNVWLLIGANSVARAIGKALADQGIPVQLSDPAWEHCKLARMSGLPCYFGNPQSEHAERHLPLTSISTVLALSPSRHNNALGVLHFAHLYGEEKVHSLRSSEQHGKANRESATFRARQNLFGADINFARLSGLLSRGGQIKATRLSDTFDWDQYQEANPGAIPLFVLDTRARPSVVTGPVTPLPGELLIALQPPREGATAP
ncbi:MULTISPECIES: cation:proton antiporter [Aeromonas]|jgi:NhaP-type Na+/H+ or K+/H+ antiporter|uniref:Sodium:proton antiporter n=1 Tax=Aeromonas caviae TaxID=648 RepID=A0ABU5W8E3_AERCA|nr:MULTISPECIES: sodium:proton antiporter [Aeromonas]MBP6451083.1 sodium:proton antiporter [Aeromonas sp.]MEA9416670.1 sodium:proton antiporter [Aeromonas caviae]MEA9421597.1 sodium:proton antiporter [Aeromonas caviae]MEA9426993.1 sodium:proton antiporter [Aeromonas caviae]MEA9431618.1 sodium:proton antiporter [Aeromonas caviae]